MRAMYVYLSMEHPCCDYLEEEYLVHFSFDVDWEYAQKEAEKGLYEFIRDYEDEYYEAAAIFDPTDEDYQEYKEQCVLQWWPMTDKMTIAMLEDCDIEKDENGEDIIIIHEEYDDEED